MDRQEIMEKVANYFGIKPDEDGEYDISSYEWTAGCYTNGKNWCGEASWMSLAEFVRCIEQEFSDYFYDED